MLAREAFDWLKPEPLWENGLQSARLPDFFQPQLVKLTDDNFMATFRAAAGSNDSSQLQALVVQPTTPLVKLFHAAHGCHYLVIAELCCRIPGFPDRTVRRPDGEKVFFVLRRILNNTDEYGWVVKGETKSWKSLNGQPRTVLPDEEPLPLFPIAASGRRTIFAGYVPVATSDVYTLTAAEYNKEATTDDGTIFPIDVRIEEFTARFIDPLSNFPQQVQINSDLISVYMLLDLLDFFNLYIPNVASALTNPGGAANPTPSAAEQQLLDFLSQQTVASGAPALDVALTAVAGQRSNLEASGADPTQLGLAGYDLTTGSIHLHLDGFVSAVQNALPSPDPSTIVVPRQNTINESYALRCVYERPQCAPATQYVVSQPSQFFQLASFFDADAPSRQIRIVMPTDVSLAGIRKFQKGVTFIISKSLQEKINMLTGNEFNILKGPSSPPSGSGLDIGFICSFSFQIIFIVAFFLLLMFVIILNICFWWIAFFKICIPYPKNLLSG